MSGSIRQQIVRLALGIGLSFSVTLSVVSPVAAAGPVIVVRESDKRLTPQEQEAYLAKMKADLTAVLTKPDGSNAGEVKAAVTVVGACLKANLDSGNSVEGAQTNCGRLLDVMIGPTGTESHALTNDDLAGAAIAGGLMQEEAKRNGWSDEDAAAIGQVTMACMQQNYRSGLSGGDAWSSCKATLQGVTLVKHQAEAAPVQNEPAKPAEQVANKPPAPLEENPNVNSSRKDPDGSITEWIVNSDGQIMERTRRPDGSIEDWHDPYAQESTEAESKPSVESIVDNSAVEEGGNNEGNSKNRTGGNDKKNSNNNSGNSNHPPSSGCKCGGK